MSLIVHGQINPTTGRIERRVEQTSPTTARTPTVRRAGLDAYVASINRRWDSLPHWKQEQLKVAAYLRKLDQQIAQENAQLAVRARRIAERKVADRRPQTPLELEWERRRAGALELQRQSGGFPGFPGWRTRA
jgi:hypothetical protein